MQAEELKAHAFESLNTAHIVVRTLFLLLGTVFSFLQSWRRESKTSNFGLAQVVLDQLAVYIAFFSERCRKHYFDSIHLD